VGIIVDGKMMLEGNTHDLTKDKDLESVFFDLYSQVKGGDNL
jgi:hypothetical protein